MDVQISTGGLAALHDVFPSFRPAWASGVGLTSSKSQSEGNGVQTPDAKEGVSEYAHLRERKTHKGTLLVEGFHLPQQDFIEYLVDGLKIIENQPRAPFPRVRLEINQGLGRFDAAIRPYDDSVDALLFQTRLSFFIARTGGFSLGVGRSPAFRPRLTEAEVENQRYLAKLARKLKHLERLFRVRLALPEIYHSELLRNIEILYRGTTEGEFSIRATRIRARDLLLSDVDITEPPFTGCGKFRCEKGESIQFLGQTWAAGPITVSAGQALVADSRVIQEMIEAPERPVDVDFEVFDNQVGYRFEEFLGRRKLESAESLSQLKSELRTQEPEELVSLLDDSLQADVSPFEASHIATGWLWSHDFPDRYCSQDPELDREHGWWRVPISLVYTSGGGGSVGEIAIDLKSGAVKALTPIDEMRGRGSVLAAELINAR